MGILDRFKKKKSAPEAPAAQPQSAPVQEPQQAPAQEDDTPRGFPSFLMVVPRDVEEIKDLDALMHHLRTALEADSTVEILQFGTDDEGMPRLSLGYQDETYEINLIPETFQLDGLYRLCHDLPQEDLEQLTEVIGVTVQTFFHEDVQAGLHLQLKVLNALLENPLAVVDFSRERVLSPVWLRMAAESAVPPALSYLFSIQAVADNEHSAWLHSHGLYRCGYPEVEALNVPHDRVPMVGEILSCFAETILDRGGFPPEDQPVCLARISEEELLLVSWRRWENCMEEYPADCLGVGENRDESHRGPSAVVSFYNSPEDADAQRRLPLAQLDPERYQHPIYNLSTEETERMQALAVERLDWLRKGLTLPDAKAIVKMGLDQDEDRAEEDDFYNGKEHIWMEVQTLKEDTVVAQLINEPYFIRALHMGDELEVELSRLTDWRLFARERQITPDEVYLLADLQE